MLRIDLCQAPKNREAMDHISIFFPRPRQRERCEHRLSRVLADLGRHHLCPTFSPVGLSTNTRLGRESHGSFPYRALSLSLSMPCGSSLGTNLAIFHWFMRNVKLMMRCGETGLSFLWLGVRSRQAV